MPQLLNGASTAVQFGLLRKGSRTFALLGKASLNGAVPFERSDIGRSWALTAEYGCLRLERLCGDEEITGDSLVLTTPFSYDYGVVGPKSAPDLVRAVFGLMPSEFDQLVGALRNGTFPVLGFSRLPLKCCIGGTIIPGCWPHLIISNAELYGNVISLESFVRIVVSSLPQGLLSVRFPSLQPVVKHLMKLMIAYRKGIPYTAETLQMAARDNEISR